MTVTKLFVVKLQAYSVQHFQKMNSFTDFIFKNFAYFSVITILRTISDWQGSNAVLNYKEQTKGKKRKVIEAKTAKVLKECL